MCANASACSIRDTGVWPSVSRCRMNFDADLTVPQLLTLSTAEFAAYRDWWEQIRELLSPQHAADIEQQLCREADALNRLAVLESHPGRRARAHL
jgi:hypothetical protein